MMRNDTAIGKNRTGLDLSPIDKHDVLEVTELTVPSMEGHEHDAVEARGEYIEEGETIGTVPPPASVKGVASTGAAALKGTRATVFIDKLGERLAFERTGTRMYDSLIAKSEASEPLLGGPTTEDLMHIRAEELAHFELVRDAMKSLGADPTAVTPSADVAAVASSGLLQVVSDPRTSLKQSLDAVLVAELADHDGWMLLVELARGVGHEELAKRFEAAHATEGEHLVKLRKWISDSTLFAASAGKAAKI